jgi:hypothetical protein
LEDLTMACAIRFPLGQTVATPGALNAFTRTGTSPLPFLVRHQSGEWGDVDKEDKRANDRALISGGRLLPASTDSARCWSVELSLALGEKGEGG